MPVFFRNRTQFIIFLLITLLGLTEMVFAGCPALPNPFVNDMGTWTVLGNSCFPSDAAASAACEVNELGEIPCEKYACDNGYCFDMQLANETVEFYITYAQANTFTFWIGWIDPGTNENICSSERAELEQRCGGADKYTINEETCVGYCNEIDSYCPAQCTRSCQLLRDSHFCDPWGFNMDDECNWSCNVAPECGQEYEQACIECGGCEHISTFYNKTCTAICENESCADEMDQANIDCPDGYSMDTQTCEYRCNNCRDLEKSCQQKCGGEGTFQCSESDGKPTDYICECSPKKDCEAFYESCRRACSSPGCGGVESQKCEMSDGEIYYSKCICKTCGDKPPDPNDPSDPSDDPGDGSDITGWLKAIKENTDTMVRQNDEHSGWFSSLNSNTDDIEGLLRSIYNKNTSVNVAATDVSGVISSVNNVNSTLQGVGSDVRTIKDGIGSVSEDVGGIKDGLSNLEIGIGAGDYTGREMSESGYGEAPTDDDLPTAEETDSAFGTLETEEEGTGYRSQISTAISDLSLPVSSPECSIAWTLPSMPYIGGRTFHLNFCDYASLIASIGSVLVWITAAYQLYLFT